MTEAEARVRVGVVGLARMDGVKALTWRSRSATKIAKVAEPENGFLDRRVRSNVDSITRTLLPAA